MVRGRKRDLTAAPTRQLTQQRDYRARKARYLTELEQRCLKAEDENVRLRRELELARAAIPFGSPQEVVQVSSELLRDLLNASASIARFQQITAPRAPVPLDVNSFHHRQPSISSYSQPPAGPSNLRHSESSSPRQASSQPITILPSHVLALQEFRAHPSPPNRILSPIDERRMDRTPASSSTSSQARETSPSPSLGSEECCGGYIDCTQLIEEDEGEDEEGEGEGDEDEDFGIYHLTHTSKLRFSQGDFRKDAER
ncbi:uncharacterized protein F5891DRAFT_502135 [Suillus fuscotomentosus]|uniref:BZIP domain-containing protein n=1 Tax=Suillus fuscotomentosus TaxID=1912939 RepID=A0AAD4E1M6_9AGAM|nr:uncharacterized protein F5891DRAFT_502135 [Suillus fuscotomentosus]KAG1898059.1 hypothetical protein F5891DRAFT_502135 [Suillus fuscotomentosus]